jgi:hypothetical protein
VNFQQLVAKLKLEGSRQGSAPASPATSSREDSRLWGWVADEWVSLQTMGIPWRFMRATANFSTQVGKSFYTQAEVGQPFTSAWPTAYDGYRPSTVFDGAQSLLHPERDYDTLRRLALSGGLPSVPSHFAVTPSMNLMLWPTPDRIGTIDIDLVRAPLLLVAPADEPVGLPTHHRLILVWGALKRLAIDDAAAELLQRANSEYDSAWSRLWDEQGPDIAISSGGL